MVEVATRREEKILKGSILKNSQTPVASTSVPTFIASDSEYDFLTNQNNNMAKRFWIILRRERNLFILGAQTKNLSSRDPIPSLILITISSHSTLLQCFFYYYVRSYLLINFFLLVLQLLLSISIKFFILHLPFDTKYKAVALCWKEATFLTYCFYNIQFLYAYNFELLK